MSHQTISSILNGRTVCFVDIDFDFNCVICMNVADDPVRCSGLCAAIFCNDCLKQALTRARSCPSCKRSNSQALKDVMIRSQILKHQVYCVNSGREASSEEEEKSAPDDKCTWIGKYEQLIGHITHCDFEMVSCVNDDRSLTRMFTSNRTMQTLHGRCQGYRYDRAC